jgi:alkylation response protein AidB-like acyl-CoA dehydrogenase
VPEEAGGVGMKMVAVAALAEEIGRAALPSPLIATLLATCVLREPGTPRRRLARADRRGRGGDAGGDQRRGLLGAADTDVAPGPDGDGVVLTAPRGSSRTRARRVFFVVARAGAGVGLYAVPPTRRARHRARPHRRPDARPGDRRAPGVRCPDAVVAATRARRRAARAATPAMLVIVAADLCGAAEWQLQTTAEYAKVRKQFDRPIGFFQAVKHPIVNMMIAIDRARSLV